ncbi:MAG: MFS transporter [Candidatus Pacearchaeota archaeon]
MHHRHYFPFRHLKYPIEFLKLPKSIKYGFVIFLIYSFGWGFAEPYFAIYSNKVLGSYTNVGLVYAIFNFIGLITSLSLGTILDKINKRNLIRFILLFYLPFSYLLLQIKNLTNFITFRIYHGVIATSLWVSGEVYIRRHSPRRRTVESVALFDLASVIGMILGAIASAFLISWLSFNIFYSISIFAFLALLLSAYMPDKEKSEIKKVMLVREIKKEFVNFFRYKKLRKITLFLFFYIIVSATMSIIFPLYLKHIGASLTEIGLIFALFYFPFLLEGYFAWIRNKKALLISSLAATSLLFLILFFINNIVTIFLLSLLIGIFFAAIGPTLSGRITNFMPLKKRGQLTSVLDVIRHLALVVSFLFSGFIADKLGLNFVFLINFLILAILTFFVRKIY